MYITNIYICLIKTKTNGTDIIHKFSRVHSQNNIKTIQIYSFFDIQINYFVMLLIFKIFHTKPLNFHHFEYVKF